MAMTVDEIRAALVRRNAAIGRPYPEAVREAVMDVVDQRRRKGVGLAGVAVELGVSATTLRKWGRSVRSARALVAKPKFREVEVVAASPLASAIVIHGPAGLRIEGATIADVAELVRRLG
jgi:hypothetical protein